MNRAHKSAEPPPESVSHLFPALHRELRGLARSRLAGSARPTLLDTSALVNEAFLRMQGAGQIDLKDREHFLAYAATTMRSIVIDAVRRRRAVRRGGLADRVTLDTVAQIAASAPDDEILDVHEALDTLRSVDARLVRVVELRYFAGFTDAEIGVALGTNERTVRRDWARARLLLAEIIGH